MSQSEPFMGMRSTADWESDQVPKSFRDMILTLYPNGRAPLTALSGRMPSDPLDNYEINYYVQTLPEQGGLMQGVGLYTDRALGVALATNTVPAGTVLFARVKAAQTHGYACVGEFAPGHVVVLRYTEDSEVDITAKVMTVKKNGTSSYVEIQTLEAAAVDSYGYGLTNADEIYIIGSMRPEGAMPRSAVNYIPTPYRNVMQIFSTTLEITGSNIPQDVRGGMKGPAKLVAMRKEKAELHAMEMEKAFIWGKLTEGFGDNNAPERTLGGVLSFIRTYAAANISNYKLNGSYSGKTWLQGGYQWFEDVLASIFRYGEMKERIGFCGDLAFIYVNRLIRSMGDEVLSPSTKVFGIQVFDWLSPSGMVHLWTHPLFNLMPSSRRSLLLYDPKDVKYVPKRGRDTKKSDVTPAGFDGIREEYLTEATIELHFPEKFGFLTGIGQDNAV